MQAFSNLVITSICNWGSSGKKSTPAVDVELDDMHESIDTATVQTTSACVKIKRENKLHVEDVGQVFGADCGRTSVDTRFV